MAGTGALLYTVGMSGGIAIGQDGDREEVIRKFAYDFNRGFLRGGEDFNEKLKALRGHTLGCHCKPYACHGDVLAEYLIKLDDGE